MKELEITILRVLEESAPGLAREKRLFAEVNVEHSTAVTKADFFAALRALQNKASGPQIVGVGGEDGTKWTITAEGKIRLATL